jgi:hypothetical protein
MASVLCSAHLNVPSLQVHERDIASGWGFWRFAVINIARSQLHLQRS